MKRTDRTEKRSSIIDLVNPIVEQAFGRRFKGNYDFEDHSLFDGSTGLKEINRLCMIGKRRLLGLSCEYAGQLGSFRHQEADGSVIAVFPNYESAAKKYAELYKQKTGKEVQIILTQEINSGLDIKEFLKKR